MGSFARRIVTLPLFWPCATLALLVLLNAIAESGFPRDRNGATATSTATSSTS